MSESQSPPRLSVVEEPAETEAPAAPRSRGSRAHWLLLAAMLLFACWYAARWHLRRGEHTSEQDDAPEGTVTVTRHAHVQTSLNATHVRLLQEDGAPVVCGKLNAAAAMDRKSYF